MDLLNKYFTANNKLLKYVVLLMFIILPIIGFLLGIQYDRHLLLPKNVTEEIIKITPTNVTNFTLPSLDTTSWKTYTTNDKMDIPEGFLQKYPAVVASQISFKYPNTWKLVKEDRSGYSGTEGAEYLTFYLAKSDPKYSNCKSEGGCNNDAFINFGIGAVPQNLEDFDSEFWGYGFLSERDEEIMINGKKAHISYYLEESRYPRGTLFKLSPTTQVNVESSLYWSNDNALSSQPDEFNSKTVEEINSIISSIKFTDQDTSNSVIPNLSAFRINIPAGWNKKVQPFGAENTFGFISYYFSDNECKGNNCQGVRLTKNNNKLDLVFEKIFDDGGEQCSNKVTYETLNNGWYRIKDSKNYLYSRDNISINRTLEQDYIRSFGSRDDEWSAIGGNTYKVCVFGRGELLKAIPDGDTPQTFDGAVMLEYPRIPLNTQPSILQEIDTIITSMGEFKKWNE